ncbi:MAG: hypothetical protein ACK5KT_10930 [Dysgonomonas sp.]
MKKLIYILSILPFFFQCTASKEEVHYEGYATLELRLKGKQYERLSVLAMYYLNKDEYSKGSRFLRCEGISKDGYNWIFQIPDSLRKYKVHCRINTKPFDSENNVDYILSFSSIDLQHRVSIWTISLEEKETIVKATYVKQKEINADYRWEYPLFDSVAISPIIAQDLFFVEIDEKEKYADWELEFRYPEYGLMPEDNYEEALKECIELAKKYPNSSSLIGRMGPGMGFRSKKDIKKIFNTFSKETRKRVEENEPYITEYLSAQTKHVDINKLKLENSKTGELEAVIADQFKPTLIIFSCIGLESYDKVIPFLKDSIGDKSRSLNIVFINIDSDNDNKWNTLMEKEQAPWRSYNAGDARWALSDTYQYWGTSSVICVINGKADVRFRRSHSRLLEIIKSL